MEYDPDADDRVDGKKLESPEEEGSDQRLSAEVTAEINESTTEVER